MSSKKEKNEIPSDQLPFYDALIANHHEVERKGATLPYTSYNGHMFTFLSANGIMGIRLPEKERTDFITKYKTSLMEAHETILKEYVAVPESLLKKSQELKKYLDLSFEYVKTLKLKQQKKDKPEKKKK